MLQTNVNGIIYKNAHPAAVFPTFGELTRTSSAHDFVRNAIGLLTKIELTGDGKLVFAGNIRTSAVHSVELIRGDSIKLLVVTKSGTEYLFNVR